LEEGYTASLIPPVSGYRRGTIRLDRLATRRAIFLRRKLTSMARTQTSVSRLTKGSPMHKLLPVLFVVAMIDHSAVASQDGKKITQNLASESLEQFVTENSTNSSWPKLTSDVPRETSSSNEPQSSELGVLLLHKISSYEEMTGHDKATSLKAAILYSALSSILEQSGGYINLCLADAVNRLTISRISELIVEKPQDDHEVATGVNALASTRFPAQVFLDAIHDEPSLKITPGVDLSSIDEKTLRDRVNRAVGADEGYVLQQYANGQETTSRLIGNVNMAVLLHRMGQTEVMGTVELAGLAEFYKLGGHLVDISLIDNRPFKAIMKGKEINYKSEIMHVNKVTGTAILEMQREIKDHGPISFVGIALQ